MRCTCGLDLYRDRRGALRHLATGSEFCYPDLAHLDAWSTTATPEEGP